MERQDVQINQTRILIRLVTVIIVLLSLYRDIFRTLPHLMPEAYSKPFQISKMIGHIENHGTVKIFIQSKRCFNVKSSTYYFHMKTKILADFQICISVSQNFSMFWQKLGLLETIVNKCSIFSLIFSLHQYVCKHMHQECPV